MQDKFLTKIAVFVHYQNFVDAYKLHHNTDRVELNFWEGFNKNLMNILHDKEFIMPEVETVKNIGTWVFFSKEAMEDPRRKSFYRFVDMIDLIAGKIVNAANKAEGEMICQMMMGAFQKRFDVLILASSDTVFVPVVHRLQDYFGINVIQVGFKTDDEQNPNIADLRTRSYGHIRLEEYDKQLQKK